MKQLKKGKIAIIAAVVLVAALIIYAFGITSSGYWLISKLKPDTKEQKMSFSSASVTGQTISDEGFVLLQNNENFLPIKTSSSNKSKLNLFGMRGIQLAFNGGGSASTDPTKSIKLETALQGSKGNFELNTDLLNLYYNYFKSGKISISETKAPVNGGASEFVEKPQSGLLPEVPLTAFNDTKILSTGKTLLESAKEFSDTAIIVIGRAGSELQDLSPSFLKFTKDEVALLNLLNKTFSKIVMVIDSAQILEIGQIEKFKSIKSVVWIGYPGESGTESLAKILNGSVNPSGRLPDTWLYNNLDHPSANNFGNLDNNGNWIPGSFKYNNALTITASAIVGGGDISVGYYKDYAEGIYVGYKYFETRNDTDKSFNYNNVVKYPFGYGLSYTSFDKEMLSMTENNGVITVRVGVRNTGKVTGKTVLQLYYNPPYSGKIEKSTVNLVAFKKSNNIEPGNTEIYSISFNKEDMASYDYKENHSYVLEEGKYEISLREDSHSVIDTKTYTLAKEIIYNNKNSGKRSSDKVVAEDRFADANRFDDYLTRNWNPKSRAFTGPKESDADANAKILDALLYEPQTDKDLGYKESDTPKVGVKLPTTIMLSELKNTPKESKKWDDFISQLTIEELSGIAGNGAWVLEAVERLGVPKSKTPDGSMAIAATTYSGSAMGTDGAGVTYPSPVIVAATWNTELAFLQGESVSKEAKALGYNGWYAPSMNIHRTPFDGRNFEYYSESALLSGKMAANVSKACQDNGLLVFIKHFIMHDRQLNGRDQIMSWANEQTIREIYLKPFELSVKEGGALGAMSSFDFIGHTWAGAHDGLLNKVLRDEWGFNGFVITDANIYPHMNIQQMILNGGDVSLDVLAGWMGGAHHSSEFIELAKNPEYKASVITNLQRAAKNTLFAVSRTWFVK